MPTSHEIGHRIGNETKPGQWFTLDRATVATIAPIPGFSVAESIMENIVGSAYEFTFTEGENGITFRRRKQPLTDGLRTYVSPDRLHFFNLRTDGLYELKTR